jgi:hypothetical protein
MRVVAAALKELAMKCSALLRLVITIRKPAIPTSLNELSESTANFVAND